MKTWKTKWSSYLGYRLIFDRVDSWQTCGITDGCLTAALQTLTPKYWKTTWSVPLIFHWLKTISRISLTKKRLILIAQQIYLQRGLKESKFRLKGQHIRIPILTFPVIIQKLKHDFPVWFLMTAALQWNQSEFLLWAQESRFPLNFIWRVYETNK